MQYAIKCRIAIRCARARGRLNGQALAHSPSRVPPVSVRYICLETPASIGFQASGLFHTPSPFFAPFLAAVVASTSAVASASSSDPASGCARWPPRNAGFYLCNPSAFSVSNTAGRAPTLPMKPLMLGHLPRSILCRLVQLSTVNR